MFFAWELDIWKIWDPGCPIPRILRLVSVHHHAKWPSHFKCRKSALRSLTQSDHSTLSADGGIWKCKVFCLLKLFPWFY